MDETAWSEENWATLGAEIAKARRAKGWDQQELARRSGNSPNTISNYERGRTPRSKRLPGGLLRVAEALGWPPYAVSEIVAGAVPKNVLDPNGRLYPPVPSSYRAPSRTVRFRDLELEEAGHVAQDTFVRQMKRFRKFKNVGVDELAVRVARLGGGISTTDLKRVEEGTRLIKQADAELIARALDTTIEWLISSGFREDAPAPLQAPLTAEELEVEAKALENRIFEAGTRVNGAREQYTHAKHMEEVAIQQAAYARVILEQADTEKRQLEHQYQYLLGRIDSILESRGEQKIVQTRLIYGDEDEDE